MIHNSHCPYCRKEMIQAENQPTSRSVEHMIPKAILTTPRDGDFYACRKCNSAKSHIDYVLAVVAKAQSADSELAASALKGAILRTDNTSRRFVEMFETARPQEDGVHMSIPISGQDLYEYLCYLAKGQHFRSTGTMYGSYTQVIQVEFIGKQVLASLEQHYESGLNANPFIDLRSNPGTESIGGGECLIYSAGPEHLFLFHNYTGAIVRVLERTRRTVKAAREKRVALIKEFEHRTFEVQSGK